MNFQLIKFLKNTALKPFFTAALVLFQLFQLSEAVQFTDAAGRELNLPEQIKRVYPTSPVAALYVYSLAPETLVGWNQRLTPDQKQFLLPEVRNLPRVGGWFGKSGTAKLETLLATRPDVILSISDLRDTDIDFANRLQEQSGIPVIMGNGSLECAAELYQQLGPIFQKEACATQLADYCKYVFEDTKRLSSLIPTTERIRVYYAEGPKGLQTDSAQSIHSESFRHVAADLVFKSKSKNATGRSRISMEQVLLWQPDAIFMEKAKGASAGKFPEWLNDDGWKSLPAYKTNRLYQIPHLPFNWMDRPPSINRLIGMRWAFWCLYPETAEASFDMVEETQKFYQLFYHYSLSKTQATQMLRDSTL